MQSMWGTEAEQHGEDLQGFRSGGEPARMVIGRPRTPRPEGAGASWKARQQRS